MSPLGLSMHISNWIMQDLYLEDILKLIGYNAPDDYTPDSTGIEGGSSTAKGALSRLQTATTEQAIMDAFLQGDEDSWERLMELTGAQGGTQDTALVNVAHPSTGEAFASCCCLPKTLLDMA